MRLCSSMNRGDEDLPTGFALNERANPLRGAGRDVASCRPECHGPQTGLPLHPRWFSIEFNALTMRLKERHVDLSRDIHPLTDFKRHTAEFLRQLKETGQPLVLTVNGKAELVVQDAKSYQRLLELSERLATVHAVKDGLASLERGEGRSMDDVFDDLEKRLRAKARS